MAKKKTSTTKSGSTFDAPQSRNEAILQNILGANNVLGAPQSRIEALLMQILEQGGGGGGGLSDSAKAALITLLEKVAYIDDNGQQYIDNLEDALYNRTLSSISAVFTQGGATITPNTPLDDLRQYLVVTATYSDGTTRTVTDYTLSGTLTVGTSTITATWKDKTDTFSVTVSTAPLWVFTDGYAISKGTSGTATNKVWRATTPARACGAEPIANDNYVFTVTDSNKYNLVAYDITDLTKITNGVPAAAVDGYMYQGGTKTISWKTTDSVSTAYVWLSLKKLDGTAFTASELANGAEAVFTYTRS